jgi:hypothetical protein
MPILSDRRGSNSSYGASLRSNSRKICSRRACSAPKASMWAMRFWIRPWAPKKSLRATWLRVGRTAGGWASQSRNACRPETCRRGAFRARPVFRLEGTRLLPARYAYGGRAMSSRIDKEALRTLTEVTQPSAAQITDESGVAPLSRGRGVAAGLRSGRP